MKKILLFAFILSSLSAFSTNYYVATTGNDSHAGTSISPFLTIQHAADVVNPGDSVIVKDGVYSTTQDIGISIMTSGTSGSPITFKAEHKSGAIIDGSSYTTDSGCGFICGNYSSGNASYINIQDFEIRNIGRLAVYIMEGSTNVKVSGNYIHDVGRKCTSTDYGMVGVCARDASYLTIEKNKFANIGRYANGESGCTNSNTNYQANDQGVYLDGSSNVVVSYNIFYNCNRGWGVQVYSGADVLASNVAIENNTFAYGNPYKDGCMIIIASPIENSTIINNIFYLSGTGGSPLAAIDTQYGTFTNVVANHNLVYGGSNLMITDTKSGLTVTSNLLNVNPLFVSPSTYDFRLQSTSPAINAGTSVGLSTDYLKDAIIGNPDIGAYEYVTTYYSVSESGTATRNNCGAGYTGSTVTYTVSAGAYTSIISQADANNQAIADATANKQTYANTNGTCTPFSQPLWNSVKQPTKYDNGLWPQKRLVIPRDTTNKITGSIAVMNGNFFLKDTTKWKLAGSVPLSGLLYWNPSTSRYEPYGTKAGSDPGYAYFYTGSDPPSFLNLINLDGALNAYYYQGMELMVTDGSYISDLQPLKLQFTQGSSNMVLKHDRGETDFYNLNTSTNHPGPVFIGSRDTALLVQPGNGQFIKVDDYKKTFTVNMDTVKLSRLTASKTLALDANKNIITVDPLDISGKVPYTGATGVVNLGAYDLTVNGVIVGKGNNSLISNTAVGASALSGANSGSASNTAVGYNSLAANTTGYSNSGYGAYSLHNITTGYSNVAVGYAAGNYISGSGSNTTSTNSIYLGASSGASANGNDNEIIIGTGQYGHGSNTATWGNTSITDHYFTGVLHGGSFVKSGGTSSQFLKADGSVDTSSYLTSLSGLGWYLQSPSGYVNVNHADTVNYVAGTGISISTTSIAPFSKKTLTITATGEVPLTFSSPLTRTGNTISHNTTGAGSAVQYDDSHGSFVSAFTYDNYGHASMSARHLAQADVPFAASDTNTVHKTGTQTITGAKTFSSVITAPSGNSTNWNSAYGWGDWHGGGTLTGALNGTTLTASGAITAPSVYASVSAIEGGGIYLRSYNWQEWFGINYVGYNGGTTQYRNTGIYDGKNNLILGLIGDTKAATFAGSVTASGAITSPNFPIGGTVSFGSTDFTKTVTIGQTMANTTYKVCVQNTSYPGSGLGYYYVTNKTTTTFDVVFVAHNANSFDMDWILLP